MPLGGMPMPFGFFSFLVLSCSIPVSLGVNPEGWLPSFAVNFDSIGVYCAGDFPPHTPQILQPWYNEHLGNTITGRYDSLGKICLVHGFSGTLINAGGYCPIISEDPQTLSFTLNQFAPDFGLALYCKTKCWCTGGLSMGTRTISGAGTVRQRGSRRSYYTYYRQSHVVAAIPLVSIIGRTDFVSLRYTDDLTIPLLRDNVIYLTGEPIERFVCRDNMPRPVVSSPLANSNYRTLFEFCASSLFGGSEKGNMGGYCKDDIIFGPSWDQDPNLAHPSLLGIEMARAYCFSQCHCIISDVEPQLVRRLPWASTFAVDTTNGGVVVHDMSLAPDAARPSFTIIPPNPAGGGSGSGSGSSSVSGQSSSLLSSTVNLTAVCDGNESHFLCRPPPSLLGDESRKTAQLDMATKNPITHHRRPYVPPVQSCGGSCNGAADCSSGCSCTVDLSIPALHQLGKDPLYPAASCLLFSAAMLAFGNSKPNGLGGRSIGSDQPDQRIQQNQEDQHASQGQQENRRPILACACNSTYISFGCCDTQTGLIWESGGLKLGKLEL